MAIEFTRDDWTRIGETYGAWWAGELGRPVINVAVTGRDPGRAAPAEQHAFAAQYGLETPVERIVDAWDYDLCCRRYPGDAFPSTWLNFGAGVLAAFCGARLEPAEDTVWFHPPDERPISELDLTYRSDSPWLGRIKALAHAAMDRWDGLVQVGQTDLGGNLDVVSTFRPGEKLLLDLYDHPDDVRRITWAEHELWFRSFEEIDAALQPTNPGYSCWTPIFATEPYYMLQCDFSYMISPQMFDDFVKPELAASCKRLAHPFYHLDGPGQLAHLDSLLEIPELAGVQWIPGAGQPGQDAWPDVHRRIHAAGKRIQLYGGPEVLDAVAEQIGDAGGIVLIGEVGPEDEPKLIEALKRYGAV
ncbi:MAG: hypothetical protein KGY99_06025 [Phycisphaerae bacterium]|nr:hypothetical protein [Phycisphaerae bacterium]